MSFLVLPPEINSAATYSGAGSAPMLEVEMAFWYVRAQRRALT
jgi:hypothetical protein